MPGSHPSPPPHPERTLTLTQRAYLPEHYTIGPHIRGRGELSSEQRLHRHPANGKEAMSGIDVHLVGHEVARHAKIGDLEVPVLSDQNIATGKVAMDDVKTRQVFLSKYI